MSMSHDNPNYADPDYPYPERRRDEDQEYDRWRDAELCRPKAYDEMKQRSANEEVQPWPQPSSL